MFFDPSARVYSRRRFRKSRSRGPEPSCCNIKVLVYGERTISVHMSPVFEKGTIAPVDALNLLSSDMKGPDRSVISWEHLFEQHEMKENPLKYFQKQSPGRKTRHCWPTCTLVRDRNCVYAEANFKHNLKIGCIILLVPVLAKWGFEDAIQRQTTKSIRTLWHCNTKLMSRPSRTGLYSFYGRWCESVACLDSRRECAIKEAGVIRA